MKEYAEQNAFSYMNFTVRPPSIWDRIGWWFQQMFQSIFSNPNTPWLTRIIYYMVVLLVIGAAIYYMVRLRYGGVITADYKGSGVSTPGLEETTDEDFNSLVEGALREKNYKLAIRYLYLKTLAQLAKRELIKLKDWKSPYDYQRELNDEQAAAYMQVAKLFEYVWYGDFNAGVKEYEEGKSLSNRLLDRL